MNNLRITAASVDRSEAENESLVGDVLRDR